MPLRLFALASAAVVLAARLAAADPAYQSAQAKVDKLTNNELKPGEVVMLTPAEINAWVAAKVPEEVPQGIRDTKIELGEDTASASAVVDFLKIQQSRGKSPGLVVSMFQGERPLKISVRVASFGGKITVFLTRVELSGVVIEGMALDLLIKTFFLPMYPEAKIGQPVDFDYNIDHIQIRPDGLRIYIKK
jgi:hypothetical protein